MNVSEFLILAMANRAYAKKEWVYGVFGLLVDPPTKAIDYLPVFNAKGVCQFSVKGEAPVTLTGVKPNEPIARFSDRITLPAKSVPNLTKQVETTVGNLFFNYIVLVEPFKHKVEFVTGVIKISDIEEQIAYRLADNLPLEERNDKDLYCDEYLIFKDRAFYLPNFNQLAVPAASPKNLVGAPGMDALKKALLKEFGDDLTNPVNVARIYEAIVNLDKGHVDDFGRGFLIENKQWENIRVKVHGMMGLLSGFSESEKPVLIVKSLVEGWDFDNLAAMINSARDGSFSRGWETQFGGVEAKRNIRANQNSAIVPGDCGTNITKSVSVTARNKNEQLNLYHMVDSKPVLITRENLTALIGTTIQRRSPQGCRASDTDYCSICMGRSLAETPESLGARGGEMGNTFLNAFMAKMHVSTLKLAHYNIKKSLS